MDLHELINWRGLSRELGANSDSVRKGRVPRKYKREVDNMFFFLDMWCRHLDWDGLRVDSGGSDLGRLMDWLMDEDRESANTWFSSGDLRNVAREIEFRLNNKNERL